jgi:cobalt-zinc-cadmium efflux system outer membrane protein
VERETASAEEMTQRLLREVAASFLEALAARERQFLLAANNQVAAEFLGIAERRYQAGDIPILEVNLARTSTARARSGLRIADADFALAMGALRVLLGVAPGESLTIRGDLRDRPDYDSDALLARAQAARADLRALAAELRQAEADVRLGEGFRWPDLGVSTLYQREEGANVVQGGLKITLPIFSRGQELRATGNARGTRLRLELEALRSTIQQEIRTALESYQRKIEAANELEQSALPNLGENETLAQRGYEEGELGLAELLLIRREILETRLAYVDILLETRLTAIEVEFRAGVLP